MEFLCHEDKGVIANDWAKDGLSNKCPKRYGSIPNIYNEKYERNKDLDVRNKGTQHVTNIDELLYKLKVPVRGRGKRRYTVL